MTEEQIGMLVQFFKAMADENRLKILGVLATRETNVEELSALLGIRAPTVSHHLQKLKDNGLVKMRADGNTHWYSLQGERLATMNREFMNTQQLASFVEHSAEEAWEQKVIRDFFNGDQLKEIPASRRKRLVILQWLANRFDYGTRYPESQVNEIIKRHHADCAALRRELVGNRLMQREGGQYWRIIASESGEQENAT